MNSESVNSIQVAISLHTPQHKQKRRRNQAHSTSSPKVHGQDTPSMNGAGESTNTGHHGDGTAPCRQNSTASATPCFDHFSADTTLHGLRHVSLTTSHPAQCLTWLLLMLAMSACYLTLTLQSVVKYYRFESITRMSRIATFSLDFPAVSICQQNIFPYSYVANDTATQDWISYFELNPDSYLTEDELENATAILELYNLTDVYWYTLSQLLTKCEFDAEPINCYQFAVDNLSEQSQCLTLEIPKRTTKPGYPHGLKVWVNVSVEDYFVSASYGAGIKVLVHEPGIYPRVSEQAMAVAPGTEAYLSIDKNVIVDLPPPYSTVECVQDDTLRSYEHILESGEYTFEGCMLNCLLQYTLSSCNCTYDYDNGCTLVDYYLCVRARYQDYYDNCHCLYPCKQTIYDMQLSTLTLAAPLQTGADAAGGILDNMILLNVFFPSLHYTTTEQVEAFTADELISNIGGQLGLFLGASLLTLVEVLEGLFMAVWTWRNKRLRKAHKQC